METDDSEDVVLMDSPLYFHMKEMGFTDFETVEKCDVSSTTETAADFSNLKQAQHKNMLLVFFQEFYQQILQQLFKMNFELSKEIRETICESKLIEESDRALLEDIYAEHSLEEAQKAKNSYFYIFHTLLSVRCTVAISVLTLSYSLAFLTYLLPTFLNCFYFVLCVLYLVTVVCVCTFVRKWQTKSEQLKDDISELLTCAQKQHDFFKKGIRTIQEAELIARGFTLISVQATAQRLESSVTLPVRSPEKQCPELREAIFNFARTCFFCYRDTTYHLLKKFPLHKDIDMSSHYLACIKLEDLGPLFANPGSSKNSSQDSTDFFSVSSLKSLVHLMELQQSEFFRRLGLSFLHTLSLNNTFGKVPSALLIHTEMLRITSRVQEPIAHAISGLHKLQLYYKHLGTHKLDTEKKMSQEPTTSNVLPFQAAVHSLLLHLQASIIRVLDMEAEVMALPVDQKVTDEQSQSFQNMMLEVQSELNASSVCLEESFSQLTAASTTQPAVEPKMYKHLNVTPEMQKPAVCLSDLDEPVIEDQVFEAVTTNVDDYLKKDGKEDFWFTDDKETRKRSKECSTHLLKELKSVLVNKAEEHRKREAIAQAKGSEVTQDTNNLTLDADCISDSGLADSLERSEKTLVDKTPDSVESICRVGKSDSDSTGSIEIINPESPLEEKLLDFVETEHDSASTGSIELCGDSPLVETSVDLQSIIEASGFSFASSLAAQVTQRSRLLGLTQQMYVHEPEEAFGDSDVELDSNGT